MEKDGCLVLVWWLQDSEAACLKPLQGGGGGSRIRMEREVVNSLLIMDDMTILETCGARKGISLAHEGTVGRCWVH